MIVNPIIPVWLMSTICICLLFLKKKGKLPFIRQIVMVILLFVMNLRVMVPDGTVTVKVQKMNTKVLFVVDDTISMLAKDDGQRERLDYVREDCAYIMQQLEGAKFGVISFNNEAHYLCPLTDNAEHVNGMIDAIYPLGELYAKGSSMNIWRSMTADILKEAKEKDKGDVVLFFISDGEITDEESLDSFRELSKYVDYGAVLGYGTTKGGQMEIRDMFDESVYVIEDKRDFPYKPAVSKIDEDNLQKIAKDIQIDYIHMEHSSDVDVVLEEIKNNAATENQEKSEQGYRDIYYFFVIPFLLLLIYEIYDTRKRVKVI